MADSVMNYESLEQAATALKTHKENIDQMLSDLTQHLGSLTGQWEGVSKREFDEQFEKLKPNIQKFAQLLENYSKELKTEIQSEQERQQNRKTVISTNLEQGFH